jgi:flagellar hook-associated protein 3 FlgL
MSIRITQNQVVATMQSFMDNDYSNLAALEEQVSTGKSLSEPSDNPTAVAAALETTSSVAQMSQYSTNIQNGLGFMSATDTALGSVNTLLQSMRELAVEGSSDTVNSSQRPAMNAQAQQLTQQLISLVNTQYNGSYIFNGTQTTTAPIALKSSACSSPTDYSNLSMAYYNAAGQTVPATVQLKNGFDGSSIQNIIPGTFSLQMGGTTYTEGKDYTVNYSAGTITITNPALLVNASPGTADYACGQVGISFSYCAPGQNIYGSTVASGGQIMRDIDNGVSSPINISADEFMNNSTTGTNMLTTAITLGQDLLRNNTAGVASAIDSIDAVSQSVASAEATNGARENLFQSAVTTNQTETTSATSTLSGLEDVDMATATTNYTNAQNIYNAALEAGANIIQDSLATFLSG